jgi:NADH-quinone oxidoreductase subunit A
VDTALWPLALHFVIVLLLVAFMIGASYVLGERHRERATGDPYEAGMVLTGSARHRFDAQFYLVAVLFVIFDLEALFIFAWALAWREVGWTGYVEILIFIVVLLVALGYLWRVGALELRSRRQRAAK